MKQNKDKPECYRPCLSPMGWCMDFKASECLEDNDSLCQGAIGWAENGKVILTKLRALYMCKVIWGGKNALD